MALLKILLILMALPSLSWSQSASQEIPSDLMIQGRWQFYKKIWDGIEMPEPPAATLRLFFEFSENKESRLYWWHEGEGDWCERKGEYSLQEGQLVDTITWVNPKNSRFCSNDPDMQLGRITRTPVSINNGDLWLHLHLGDDPLIFVWKKLPSDPSGLSPSSSKHPQSHQ